MTKTEKWDLSDLYKSISDPKISRDKLEIEKLAKGFTKKYKGKINSKSISPKLLLSAIKEDEELLEKLFIYESFASFLHSIDTASSKIGAFYQEANEFGNKISTALTWFSLEIQQIPEQKAKELTSSPILSSYTHYLKHLRAFSPFRKSLPEEELINKLSLTGSSAFVRFYDEKSSGETFSYKGKSLPYAKIATILKDDPKVENRKLAAKSYTKTYKENQKFYSFVMNTLLLDKKIEDEIRSYKYPQEATFLEYEVKAGMVESLVKSVSKNYSLSEKYYKSKSKLLNRKLFEWDRYSAVFPDKNEKLISWTEAKEIILTSFSKFDEEFGKIAKEFFDNGWIDAEVSNKKKGGAFCSYCVPSKHPYILLSYTGKVEDVMTLAHELGHGIHAYLSRENNLKNFWPSTATAEIASVFCESIVFEYLYEKAETKRQKINLLANKIQGSFATIFRQILFYLFEVEIHKERREKGELSAEEISNLFQKQLQKMFGKGLTLTEDHKYWWMPVLHFYHYNFYVFTYAFGEALTLALFKEYKDKGDKFVKNYKNALSKGGSLSPSGITKIMGVDIEKPNFWQEGIDLLEEYVDEFEKLAKGA